MAISILRTADIDANNYNPETAGYIFGTPEYYAEASRVAIEARSALGTCTTVTDVTVTRGNETTTTNYECDYANGLIMYDGKRNITYSYAGMYPLTSASKIGDGDTQKESEFIYSYAPDGMLLAKVNITDKIVNTYEYDDYKHLTKSIAKFGNGKKTMFTSYAYDKYGRLETVKSKFATTTYTYDDKSLAVTKKVEKMVKGEETPRKTTTVYLYNANGEIVKEIAGKRETVYKYENGICMSSQTYYNHKACGSTKTRIL